MLKNNLARGWNKNNKKNINRKKDSAGSFSDVPCLLGCKIEVVIVYTQRMKTYFRLKGKNAKKRVVLKVIKLFFLGENGFKIEPT